MQAQKNILCVRMSVCVHAYMHVTEKYQSYCLQNTHDYSIYFFSFSSNSYV